MLNGMHGVESYEKSVYYRDWHADMRETGENSFGFGIWSEGNIEGKIEVKVKIEDWGANPSGTTTGRVWGFEIV